MRFFGWDNNKQVIKSREGSIREKANELVSADRNLFISLGKSKTEVEQTGQLTRIWVVVPEGFIVELDLEISFDNGKHSYKPGQDKITLEEGTYSVHLPVLFPTTNLPHSKLIGFALAGKIKACLRKNFLKILETQANRSRDLTCEWLSFLKDSEIFLSKNRFFFKNWVYSTTCI